MNDWILGIVGVVFVGVLIDIITPEGKTNLFIKSIFALVFLYVLVSPIFKLIKEQDLIDFSQFFTTEISDENEQAMMEVKFNIENYLNDNGVKGVIVEVWGYKSNDINIIEQINVDLTNLVLLNNNQHIDKYKLISELIIDVVNVDMENIVYG